MQELCQHRRFDGAKCVLNVHTTGHHGYAARPRVTRTVWDAAEVARANATNENLMALLVAVEREMEHS